MIAIIVVIGYIIIGMIINIIIDRYSKSSSHDKEILVILWPTFIIVIIFFCLYNGLVFIINYILNRLRL